MDLLILVTVGEPTGVPIEFGRRESAAIAFPYFHGNPSRMSINGIFSVMPDAMREFLLVRIIPLDVGRILQIVGPGKSREKMFHHIVDPKTGLSPHVNTSVSVLAPTATEADALSTSVFVMTPGQGARFIDTVPKCECLVISREGTKFKSEGWKSGVT